MASGAVCGPPAQRASVRNSTHGRMISNLRVSTQTHTGSTALCSCTWY